MDAQQPHRLASLDQFRGYTVVGMLLVNFISHFHFAQPTTLAHHHFFCSYADTIMPQFFFAVGFSLRLVWVKTTARRGVGPTWKKILGRCLGLIALGVLFYGTDWKFPNMQTLQTAVAERGWWRVFCSGFEREPFQTLTHIGVTSLFVLPILGAPAWVRIMGVLASLVLHWYLSAIFYFDWVWNRPGIDGGPLGFLTWTVPVVMGTLAHDQLAGGLASARRNLMIWALGLMLTGYGMSCWSTSFRTQQGNPLSFQLAEPPLMMPNVRHPSTKSSANENSAVELRPNYWMMSQRAGTPSYLIFSAGFSLAVFLIFVVLADDWNFQVGIFRTFGTNALAAYLVHSVVGDTLQKVFPADSPPLVGWLAFVIFLWFNWLAIRGLERSGVFIKL
jgi:predicted acyltransferase